MSEFTDFKAKRVEITVGAIFPYVLRGTYGTTETDDARGRLVTYVDLDEDLQDAYSITVRLSNFDEFGDWILEVKALYDTDIVGVVPTVEDLLAAYFRLETFFYEDEVLNAVCWYSGFQVGEHSGGE